MALAHEGLSDDAAAYAAYRPADPAAPLVRINMVSTLDGRVAGGDGVSGSLGGEGDRMVFSALRHLADAVLAGAQTVRAEDYGGMRVRDVLRPLREADGRTSPARIVVVTASLDLDPASRLFTDASVPPVVVTTTDSDDRALERLTDAGAEVLRVGEGRVDLTAAVAALRDRGMASLLCEGGPSMNGAFLEAGLVDELCLTLAPTVLGRHGGDPRIVEGLTDRHDLHLLQVLAHGDEILLRYQRRA